MEHAEVVYAAAKSFDEEEGGFKVDGLEDSKVWWSDVILQRKWRFDLFLIKN